MFHITVGNVLNFNCDYWICFCNSEVFIGRYISEVFISIIINIYCVVASSQVSRNFKNSFAILDWYVIVRHIINSYVHTACCIYVNCNSFLISEGNVLSFNHNVQVRSWTYFECCNGRCCIQEFLITIVVCDSFIITRM